MRRKKHIDIEDISKHNPKVNREKLDESLRAMQDLSACGVMFGPNYNLGSPYATPRPIQRKGKRQSQSPVRLSEHKH